MAVEYSGQFSALPNTLGARLNSDDQGNESRAFDAVLFDFLKVPPEQYAFQLTILDLAAFKAIQPDELSSCGWTGQRRTELSPNVVAMIRRFNQTSFWVQREVLSAQKVRTRAECLTHFIKVARRLYELKNLHSLKAVVSALQATPIFRLQQTWQLVPRRDRDRLEELAKLVSEDDNYGNLRRFLESVRLPCLPYLGLYLTDIVFIDVAHPHSGGLESHDRKLKMNNILRVIAEFQRSTYDHLQPSEHICEYLLSNRFIEELQKFVEDDYYKMSLRLEPPENDVGNNSNIINCNNAANALLGPLPSPPSGVGALVEPTAVSTAEPVNTTQLNDSTVSCSCAVRRSSSSASCPLGHGTPSNALEVSRANDVSCECSSTKNIQKSNFTKHGNRHKKNQSISGGKVLDDDLNCTHRSLSDPRTGHGRAASSVGSMSGGGTVGRSKGSTLFKGCISGAETPSSSKSDGIDQLGACALEICSASASANNNDVSARVSRSASESSSSNINGAGGSAISHRSSQSSPSQQSSANNPHVASPQNGGSPSTSASRTNRSTPLSYKDIPNSGSGSVGGLESATIAVNNMTLAAEEKVAEGPLLKKTLLRNGHRPTVARWQPYWAVLYAPGSLLLYTPKRRLFSRLSHQQGVGNSSSPSQQPCQISHNNTTASFSLNDTSLTADASSSASSSTYFYSGGLKKWLSCSSNFELSRPPAKAINLSGWMALPCTKPRKPDLFLLQEPSRGTIYKMRGGSQASALEWSQRLREAIRKSSTINLISFE